VSGGFPLNRHDLLIGENHERLKAPDEFSRRIDALANRL
jgi:hypothetical protein